MTLVKRLEKRVDERDNRFSGDYSLRLIGNGTDSKVIAVRPIDVSRRGLGFLAKEVLKSGTFFTLMIGAAKFRVEIAYCNNYLGIEHLYRCGLFLREADGNLHDACDASGLLSDENQSYQ